MLERLTHKGISYLTQVPPTSTSFYYLIGPRLISSELIRGTKLSLNTGRGRTGRAGKDRLQEDWETDRWPREEADRGSSPQERV